MKIAVTKAADVPDGPVCANWAYRTTMPAELNFRCDHYRRESQAVTDRDMGGLTDRVSHLYYSRCALFDRQLSDEFGVGPRKCFECLSATKLEAAATQSDADLEKLP